MRLSKPSPSLVISMIALVFAMTGTGIAAKSTFIDGAKIKNGSITSKKLSRTALAPEGYRLLALKDVSAKRSSAAGGAARAASAGTNYPPTPVVGTMCVNGTIAIGVSCPFAMTCPDGTKSFSDVGCPAPAAPGPAGAAGTAGAPGAAAGVAGTNRVTVPGGAVASVNFAPTTGVVTASPGFGAAQSATSSVATEIRDVFAKIVAPSAAKVPTSVTVGLIINDGTQHGTGATCNFNPRVTDSCTIDGPISVKANSTIAWIITTNDTDVGAPDFGVFDGYDRSLGFRSSTVG